MSNQLFGLANVRAAQLSVSVSHDRELVRRLMAQWHSSLNPPQGWRVAFLLLNGLTIVGVATWGRPVARLEDQIHTLQHTRSAIGPDAPRNSSTWFLARMRAWIRENMPDITRLSAYVDIEIHSGITYRGDNWRTVYSGEYQRTNWMNRPGRKFDRCELKAKYERAP